ncbi:MAG: response regulator [Chroococcus sp. CMT-3BRIN-NPC107]|nr:response regulator [Chroococcus sp. CMT-3BRIN-NPC107]
MSTVLLVEDTRSLLDLIAGYLRDSGYTVIPTNNAKDALSAAIKQQPDAIITDVVMPGMSGFELCRQLKSNPATEQVPIIICSSKSGKIDQLWGKKQGADAYVTKPFTKEQLLVAIKSVVG